MTKTNKRLLILSGIGGNEAVRIGGILGLVCTSLLLLSACSQESIRLNQKSNMKKAPKSLSLRLVSATNLHDWDIWVSPEFNAEMNQWVLLEKVVYLGKTPVQNVVVNFGKDSTQKLPEIRTQQVVSSLGDPVPLDSPTFTIHATWYDHGEQKRGEEIFQIEKIGQ